MGEEHPLTLGAVDARAQVVLGGVAVDLVVDEEVDLVVPNTEEVDLVVPNSSAPGWEGGKERNFRIKKTGVTLPTAKKTLKKTGKRPCFCFLNGRVSLYRRFSSK